MTVKEILREITSQNVDKEALVAFDFGLEWFAKKEMQTYEYSVKGVKHHGLLLREKRLPPHIKDFSGVLTVGVLLKTLKDVDSNVVLLVLADGYVRKEPEPVTYIKMYEKVFKGQVKKRILRFTNSNWSEDVMKKLVAKRVYKVTYNEPQGKFEYGVGMKNLFVKEELIGYADNLQNAVFMIQDHLEVPADLGQERRVRELYYFNITECYTVR